MVQWLRLYTEVDAGNAVSNSVWETKIPHAAWLWPKNGGRGADFNSLENI